MSPAFLRQGSKLTSPASLVATGKHVTSGPLTSCTFENFRSEENSLGVEVLCEVQLLATDGGCWRIIKLSAALVTAVWGWHSMLQVCRSVLGQSGTRSPVGSHVIGSWQHRKAAFWLLGNPGSCEVTCYKYVCLKIRVLTHATGKCVDLLGYV